MFGKKDSKEKEADNVLMDAQRPPKRRTAKQLLQFGRKSLGNKKGDVVPPRVIIPEGILTPDVSWIQSHRQIIMRIILTDVKDYHLDVNYNNIIFW